MSKKYYLLGVIGLKVDNNVSNKLVTKILKKPL